MSEGRVFFGTNPIAHKKSFVSSRDVIDFAVSLISRSNADRDTVFFEAKIREKDFILQCQEGEVFLQIFRPSMGFEGWLTALECDASVEELDVEDGELIMPCYDEGDEPHKTHVRLIGVEGVWASKQLLVGKERALLALDDIYTFEATGVWSGQSFWKDLGIV